MGLAGTMEWDKMAEKKCPSCAVARDTCCTHVHSCCQHTKGGWTLCLKLTLDLDETWLKETDTDPDLLDCIMEYAHGRGDQTMEDIDAKAFAHNFKKWQQHSMR